MYAFIYSLPQPAEMPRGDKNPTESTTKKNININNNNFNLRAQTGNKTAKPVEQLYPEQAKTE